MQYNTATNLWIPKLVIHENIFFKGVEKLVLKFKKRSQIPKKVLIYGLDGTGKSTFAEKYCKTHNLKAVCLDVDDTNFTQIPIVEFERSNHVKVKDQILSFIDDVKDSEYDTIIIDGVSSLLNLLVSNSKGLKMYGDRTVALNKILNELARSRLNFILVGQIDLETDKDEISSAVVNINSIVNEKYFCYIEKGKYLSETKKYRVADDYDLMEAEAKPKKQQNAETFETANNVETFETEARKKAKKLIETLNAENKEITLDNAKKELGLLIYDKTFSIDEGNLIWQELEVLLNG